MFKANSFCHWTFYWLLWHFFVRNLCNCLNSYVCVCLCVYKHSYTYICIHNLIFTCLILQHSRNSSSPQLLTLSVLLSLYKSVDKIQEDFIFLLSLSFGPHSVIGENFKFPSNHGEYIFFKSNNSQLGKHLFTLFSGFPRRAMVSQMCVYLPVFFILFVFFVLIYGLCVPKKSFLLKLWGKRCHPLILFPLEKVIAHCKAKAIFNLIS